MRSFSSTARLTADLTRCTSPLIGVATTRICCCHNKDGKPLGSAVGKPLSGGKKPYKKFGGNDKGIAYLLAIFESFLESKKGKKPKKRKRRSYNSSSDSNNE